MLLLARTPRHRGACRRHSRGRKACDRGARLPRRRTEHHRLDDGLEPLQARRALLSRSLSPGASRPRQHDQRSEEHTSELQSLMRTSYTVFCLKIKNTRTHKILTHTITNYTQTIK